jgi:hypothetical protein
VSLVSCAARADFLRDFLEYPQMPFEGCVCMFSCVSYLDGRRSCRQRLQACWSCVCVKISGVLVSPRFPEVGLTLLKLIETHAVTARAGCTMNTACVAYMLVCMRSACASQHALLLAGCRSL